MPYYHVFIVMDDEEAEETDLKLEDLTQHIVNPYNQGIMFMCKGTEIYPSEVTTIRVIETEQSVADIIRKKNQEMGIFAIFGNTNLGIMEKYGKEVTREFISTKPELEKEDNSKKRKS